MRLTLFLFVAVFSLIVISSIFGVQQKIFFERNQQSIRVTAFTGNIWAVPAVVGRIESQFEFGSLSEDAGIVTNVVYDLNTPAGVGLFKSLGLLMPFTNQVESRTIELKAGHCPPELTVHVESCTRFRCIESIELLCQ